MSLKEGRKRLIEAFDEISNKKPRAIASDGPLKGVVVCLTGLASEKKSGLHKMIETLGGRYTREFNLDRNTHLIAEVPQGAKFESAVSDPSIHIVTPAWLEDCWKTQKRVDEEAFTLSLKKPIKQTSVLSQLDEILAGPMEYRSLYMEERFYLLGFETDMEMKQKLSKLIRRGKGTIYWDIHEETSILMLGDTCDDSLRKAAHVLSTKHPKLPYAVSPRWVVESWKQNTYLPPTQFPPIRIAPVLSKKASVASRASLARQASTSSLFRGLTFSLVRIAPPSWAVDFDSKHQEALIKAHGGQVLTLKLMDAMRADAKDGKSQRRTCHAVCWGGRPLLELNPILSQLKRHNLCDLVLVTPIWLQACIMAQKLVEREKLSFALTPQPWPLKKLEVEISFSLTGFQGTQKVALIGLIKALGGSFDENMRKSSTHLICKKKASGLKLEKATKWGLHIVSVDWLQHIAEHGYGGMEKSKGGCESLFTLRDKEDEDST